MIQLPILCHSPDIFILNQILTNQRKLIHLRYIEFFIVSLLVQYSIAKIQLKVKEK